ncbi:MAG: alpha/beta hydrolase [Rhodoferax sp.]|nr:alpha/beta hydrolase [Rhodoferax sp.]
MISSSNSDRVVLNWDGRQQQIEYRWVGCADASAPVLVFLHEGLGSVAMWRDFPHRLCMACGLRGLVYSRPGYGRSTPRRPGERWGPDFMHRQARELLPALLAALGVDQSQPAPWLFGHSDGGSIALLYAAFAPDRVGGAIVLAPHILVEPVSVASIAQTRQAWQTTDLRDRLARYHDDPDSAFLGWNEVWLDPAFRSWDIRPELGAIGCPVLAVQGLEDEYGTLAQIRGIAERVAGTELLELAGCGHSPHRDQPEALTRAVADFLARHRRAG